MLRFFLITVSWGLNLLPRFLRRFLGQSIGWTWFYVLRFRREVVLDNLRLAFGQEKSAAEIRALAYKNFLNYGYSIVDTVCSITWSVEDYRQHVNIVGLENARALQAEGKGAFFLSVHLSCFQILPGVATANDVNLDYVMKKPKSPFAGSLMGWYLKRSGGRPLFEEGTAQDIRDGLSQGHFVAFMIDQFMGPPIGIPVKLFGREAGTVISLALLTDKRDVPVLPCYCFRDGSGKLTVAIEKAIVFPSAPAGRADRFFAKTQIFNDVVERIVRTYPEQWLWLHKRWKAYRGSTVWCATRTLTPAALLLALVVGCTSPGPTPTGIELPPDPTISVPVYEAQPVTAPSPTPEPTPEPEPIKTLPGKKKKETKAAAAPPTKTKTVPFPTIPSDQIPYEIGERLELALGWMGLPAGRALLETRKGQIFDGRETVLLWGNVLTSKLVDTIYHVDNTVETFVDKEGLVPYKFLLHMFETHQKKETRVSFDHVKKKAYYWAKRISQKWGDATDDRTDELTPGARDMWSALYYARTVNYEMGKKTGFFVFENGKNWEVELTPQANELIKTPAGAFQCWKILVKVKLNNVLSQTGDIYLWLSDDSKRYIVKFDAKIKIGSLYGTLTSIRERD